MKIVVLMCFLFAMVVSADTNFFSWPAAQTGPYPLANVLNNVLVFQPNGAPYTENDLATHRYNHHVRSATFQGTIYLATTSAGDAIESGSLGTQCALYVSTNRGLNWSAPIQVVPSQSWFGPNYGTNWTSTRVATPRNFTIYQGNVYLTCAVDVWGTNVNAGAHGEALISCQVYSNATIGPLFLISTNAYQVLDGKAVPPYDPSGVLAAPLMADSQLYGCWGGTAPGGEPLSLWVGYWWTGNSTPPEAPTTTYVEPNTFPADTSGTNYYRIWREIFSIYGPNTAQISTSTNGGKSQYTDQPADWTYPALTGIPNNPSETTGLRLTDGRYVIIGNPKSNTAQCGLDGRDPLFLAITSTASTAITNVYAIRQNVQADVSFLQYADVHGYGGAQYPGVCQSGNYLYVGYSICKQRIGFSRVLIPGLPDNNNDGYVPLVNISVGTATIGTLRTAP